MVFTSLFGDTLLTKSGEKPTEEVLSGCQAVGIYFSAHWCPPCRGFTPTLADNFTASYEAKGMKVVFVSSDRDEGSFNEYYSEMPWDAVPFSKRDVKERLSSKFGVAGIPTLIILGPDGSVISKDGRACVTRDPRGENFPWSSNAAALGAASADEATRQAASAGMHKGQTMDFVDKIKKKHRNNLVVQLLSFVVYVAFAVAWFVCYAQADEDCDSSPIKMKDVFLSFGIINVIFIVAALVTLGALMLALSDHAIKAQIYEAQGRGAEANAEAEAARNNTWLPCVLKCIIANSCLMVCGGLFVFGWGIACFISAINGGTDAKKVHCKDDTTKYWIIFFVGIAVQCCLTCRQSMATTKSS